MWRQGRRNPGFIWSEAATPHFGGDHIMDLMLSTTLDPSNRLVADTLEADWNDGLRVLARAREERERARHEDQVILDNAIRERLVAMTTDFKQVWSDPATLNRDRKRMLTHIIEDVTLIKFP